MDRWQQPVVFLMMIDHPSLDTFQRVILTLNCPGSNINLSGLTSANCMHCNNLWQFEKQAIWSTTKVPICTSVSTAVGSTTSREAQIFHLITGFRTDAKKPTKRRTESGRKKKREKMTWCCILSIIKKGVLPNRPPVKKTLNFHAKMEQVAAEWQLFNPKYFSCQFSRFPSFIY